MAENRAWKKLPDEGGWWWHWSNDHELQVFGYYVKVSSTEKAEYFISDPFNWCNELGGFWLKAEVPTPPTAVERADAEAAWLKRFQEVMAKDTAQVIADTQVDKERKP